MKVDRCVCWGISLAALKRIAGEDRLDFEQLSQRTGCCRGCGLCRPYVRLMLRTGETALPILPPGAACEREEDLEHWAAWVRERLGEARGEDSGFEI